MISILSCQQHKRLQLHLYWHIFELSYAACLPFDKKAFPPRKHIPKKHYRVEVKPASMFLWSLQSQILQTSDHLLSVGHITVIHYSVFLYLEWCQNHFRNLSSIPTPFLEQWLNMASREKSLWVFRLCGLARENHKLRTVRYDINCITWRLSAAVTTKMDIACKTKRK